MTTPAPGKVSLREQAEAAHRELALRHRVYPGLVKREKMTECEAVVELARMRAIRDTLRLFAAHEDAIRAALATAMRRQQELADAEALRGHPDVAAVLDTFPDARIDRVTPLEEQASP